MFKAASLVLKDKASEKSLLPEQNHERCQDEFYQKGVL